MTKEAHRSQQRLLWLGAFLLVSQVLLAERTLACSSEDRRELALMGYTSEQIDAQCGSGGNPFVTPSMPAASVCMTEYGSCALEDYILVGERCRCFTDYGEAAYGIAR